VCELHRNGLFHSDLHEKNILVDCNNYQPKLIDFGNIGGAINDSYIDGVKKDTKSLFIIIRQVSKQKRECQDLFDLCEDYLNHKDKNLEDFRVAYYEFLRRHGLLQLKS